MARILVVYESKYGQTEKISKFIVERLKAKGHSVDLVNLAQNQFVQPEMYDGVIAGAGIYRRRYPSGLYKWAKTYSQSLNKKVTALFSVCLAVLQTKEERIERDVKNIEKKLLMRTSWNPKTRRVFAGALSYTKYNWFIKIVMKGIAKAAGGDTDTSKDFEYTNWNEVTQFTDNFVNLLPVTKERGAELSP
ncbi:MAG: menaquinone-dependent protoporphyrinogen IX dehydrogenase [Pseudobdellovibrionaceae bacterium]